MKSVVLEIKGNKAAVLDDEGVVRAIRNDGYSVGQVLALSELELKRNEIRPSNKSGISSFTRTAAAILVLAIVGGGVTAYAAPVSTVTVDGASSVEYKLNLFDRVVGVSSTDEEMTSEISDFSKEIRGMKIDDAIDLTATRFEKELMPGYDEEDVPELKVRVDGLRRRDQGFGENLDNKVRSINDINQKKFSERHKDITESSPAGSPDDLPGQVTHSLPETKPETVPDASNPPSQPETSRGVNDGDTPKDLNEQGQNGNDTFQGMPGQRYDDGSAPQDMPGQGQDDINNMPHDAPERNIRNDGSNENRAPGGNQDPPGAPQ